MARPSHLISVRVPAHLWGLLEARASSTGDTVSGVVVGALEVELADELGDLISVSAVAIEEVHGAGFVAAMAEAYGYDDPAAAAAEAS